MPGSIDYPPKNKDDAEGAPKQEGRTQELRARIAEAERAAKSDASKEGTLLGLESQLRDAEYQEQVSGMRKEIAAAEIAAKSDPSKEANLLVLEEKLRSFESKKEAKGTPAPKIEVAPVASPEGPAPLAIDDLVKMSKDGDLAGFVDMLDANHDAWSTYASGHNVFSSPSVRALWQARSKAVHAAQELEKASAPAEQQAAEQKLRAALEEMNGPLSMNVQTAIEENEKRLKGYAESTHAEHRQTIEQTVEELTKLTEKMQTGTTGPEKPLNVKMAAAEDAVKPEKEAMDAAEPAYLDAYKAYYAQRGSKENNEPEELRALKTAYDERRLAYGNALTSAAQRRLEAKGASGDAAEKNKRVLERYNRLVRYNEIIKPAAQKRYKAKLEAMNNRERSVFTKAFEWTARQNQKLEKRFGKWGARGIRALATTAIAGAFVGTGGGIAALLGWGAMRVGKSLARTAVTGTAVEAAGNIRGYFARKTQAEAQHHLDYVGRTSTELTVDDLEQYDLHRQGLEKDADELTVQKKELFARVAAAAGIGGVGAGVAAFEMLSHLPSIEHVASAPPAEPEAPAAHPEAAPAPAPAPAPEHAVPPVEHPTPAEPPHYYHREVPSSGKSALTAPTRIEATPAAATPAPESAGAPQNLVPSDYVIPHEPGTPSDLPPATHPPEDLLPPRTYMPEHETPEPSVPAEQPALEPAPAPVPEPAVAPAPEVPQYMTDAQGNQVEMPPESAYTNMPEGTPGAPEVHTEGMIPAEGEPAPAPEAPAPAVVPEPAPAPEAPAAVPEAASSAAPVEAFVNSHNVRIDPTAPHIYAYTDPNGQPMLDARGNPLYAVYGGTPEQKFEYANQFLRQSLDTHQLASVRFDAGGRVIEPSNATGLGIGPDQVSMGEGQPLPAPEPQNFTQEVRFVPSEAAATPEAPSQPSVPEPTAPASTPASAAVPESAAPQPAPEAPAAVPEAASSAAPVEAFVNSHNVRIDPTAPHVYLATGTDGTPLLDAAGNPLYSVYGGTTQSAFKTAQDFLKAHPGATARIEVTRDVAGTVEHRSAELVSDANGALGPGRLSIEGAPLPPPDPNSFTQEVSFTPSTQ